MTNKAQISAKTICSCIAIAGIVIIELTALKAGINGALLATSFAVVGGLGGYNVKNIQSLIKGKQGDEK